MDHKYESDGFLKELGQNIRALRTASSRSIQDLAVDAGLSPRFLSQVEAGRGNISVARLARIAQALQQPLQTLLPAVGTELSLRGRMRKFVETCSLEQLEEFSQWLSARHYDSAQKSIALTGVRGAGKSTIGPMLARRLAIPFVEFVSVMEKEAGMSLVEMFTIHGEAYYRQLEHDLMQKFLAASPRVVLATGGSLVTDRDTWAMVRRQCHTVWLKARPRDHWDRVVAQGDVRPMRNNPSAMDELKAMLKAREPLYSQAEVVIDTSRHSPEESVELILRALGEAPRASKAVNAGEVAPSRPRDARPAKTRTLANVAQSA